MPSSPPSHHHQPGEASSPKPTQSEAPPSKFALRRAATHRDLLALGIERFPLRGYSVTTIEDIVRDSGLTRGAFYFHFDSKEEFFLAVLRERASQRAGWWDVSDDPMSTSLEGTLAAALRNLAAVPSGSTDVWLPIIIEFSQSVRGDAAYEERLQVLYGEWITELSLLFSHLRTMGWVRTDITVEQVSADIFAYVEGHRLHAAAYGAPVFEPMLDGMMRLLRP